MKKRAIVLLLSFFLLPLSLLAQTATTFRITASIISGSGSVLPSGGNTVFYDYADGSGRYKINELQMQDFVIGLNLKIKIS